MDCGDNWSDGSGDAVADFELLVKKIREDSEKPFMRHIGPCVISMRDMRELADFLGVGAPDGIGDDAWVGRIDKAFRAYRDKHGYNGVPDRIMVALAWAGVPL